MSGKSIRGSCLCGDVTFKLAPPFVFFQYCHCSRCRKTTGSDHAANLMVTMRQFQWTTGLDYVRRYELPEAKYFCHGFCRQCGSSLPWVTRSGKHVVVPAGAIDEGLYAAPEWNVYWGSRPGWARCVSDLPTADEARKS
ncbi:MAG: GFA family protein [Xanthomonadales bacterium]|nr:GFA family protein [Xanthomonadales bacterium]